MDPNIFDIDYKGQFIDRFNEMNEVEKTNIEVLFLESEYKYLTFESAKNIAINKDADLVIWGNYIESSSGTDRFRLKYFFLGKNWNYNFVSDKIKKDTKFKRLPELQWLSEGYLQEDLDYVLWWIYGISNLYESKFGRSKQCFLNILKKYECDDTALVFMYQSNLYEKIINNSAALDLDFLHGCENGLAFNLISSFELLQKGSLHEALKYADNCIALDAGKKFYYTAVLLKAIIFEKLGNFEESKKMWSIIANNFANSIIGGMARMYTDSIIIFEDIYSFLQKINSNGDSANVSPEEIVILNRYKDMLSLFQDKEYFDAIDKEIQKMNRLASSAPKLKQYFDIALNKTMNSKYKDSNMYLDSALSIKPTALFYFFKGMNYFMQKQIDNSIINFVKCNAINPDFLPSKIYLLLLYKIKGDELKCKSILSQENLKRPNSNLIKKANKMFINDSIILKNTIKSAIKPSLNKKILQ